jgi:hypothetical protein
LITRSLNTLNSFSKSDLLSFLMDRTGINDDASTDRDGLPPVWGEGTGEFDLEETGDPEGVRSL